VWQSGLTIWQQRITDLITAIDDKELTGSAYNTAKTLFQDKIKPLIDASLTVCQSMVNDYALYEMYEAPLLDDGFTHIEEDTLEQGTSNLEREICSDMYHGLVWWNYWDSNVTALRGQLSSYQEALADLRNFQARTSSLFVETRQMQQLIWQGIESINNGTTTPNGSYTPHAGDAELWLLPLMSYVTAHVDPAGDNIKLNDAILLAKSLNLSESDITPGSVNQGIIGDCWFIATLAGMAATQAGRDKLYHDMTWNAAKSCYEVTLYWNGNAETYDVDMVYGDAGHNPNWGDPSWTSVYESALIQYAQKHYTDDPLDWISNHAATGSTAMEIITGQSAHWSVDISISKIQTALHNGQVVTVGSVPHLPTNEEHISMDDGTIIVTSHEYTVVRIDDDGNVVPQNPWGNSGTAGSAEITLTPAEYYQYFYLLSIGSI
jgi:hypothetical protein